MKRSYLGLDLVRFLAAFLVMVYHLGFGIWTVQHHVYVTDLAPIAGIASVGWVGVPVFFVLSGFVIAMSATGKSTSHFVRGRILRLYPVAWLCTGLLLVILAIVGEPASPDQAFRSIALWPVGPWVTGVFWTLGVEIVFYGLVAVTHAIIGNRAIPAVATGLTVAASAYLGARLVDMLTGNRFREFLLFFESPNGNLFLLGTAAYFAVGMNLWAVLNEPTAWRRLVLACSIVLALGVVTVAGRYYAALFPVQSWFAAPSIWIGCLASMAVSIRYSAEVASVLGRWASPIRTLGLMTYPLYLVHVVVGFRSALLLSNAWASAALGVSCSVIAAYGIVKLEPYVRAWLEGLIAVPAVRMSP